MPRWLAIVLATVGRRDEAVREINEAIRLRPDVPAYREVLDAIGQMKSGAGL